MSASQKQTATDADTDQQSINSGQGVEITNSESPLSHQDIEQNRNERLEAIRAAVTRGDYDSEDILEKALFRMLQSMEDHDSCGEDVDSSD